MKLGLVIEGAAGVCVLWSNTKRESKGKAGRANKSSVNVLEERGKLETEGQINT